MSGYRELAPSVLSKPYVAGDGAGGRAATEPDTVDAVDVYADLGQALCLE